MSGSIGEASITIGADASNLGSDVEKQSKGPLEKAGAAVGKAFTDAMATTAKVAAATVGTTLAVAVAKGFGRLEAIDTATAKLTGLGHSADQVASIMQSATAAVKGTAFGLGDAAAAAAQFSAAGVPLSQMQRTLGILASTSAVAGTSMGEMTTIFGKVAATGKLNGEVLAQLSERGLPVLSMLADHYGITAEAASAMVSQGQVDFATFQSVLEGSLGPAAQAMGQSFSGMLDNVGAALGRAGAAAQKPIFDSLKTLFPALIALLDQVTAAIIPVATVVGDLLAPAMAKLAEWLSSISFDVTADGASGFVAALGPLLPLLGGMLGFIRPLTKDIPILKDIFGGMTGPVGTLIGALIALIAIDPATLMKGFDSLAGALPGMINSLVGAIATLLPQMLSGIATNLPIFITGILGLVTAIIPALTTAIPLIVQTFATLIPQILTTLLAAVPTILTAALSLFQSLITAIITVIPQVVASLVAMLPQIATALITALPLIIDAALSLFMGLLDGLVTATPVIIAAVLELLPQLIDTLLGMLPTIIDSAITLFLGVVTGLANAIPQILTALIGMLPQLITTLIGMIPRLIDGAVRLFTGIVDALPKIIPQLITAVIGLIPVIVQTLISLIPQLIQAGMDLIGGLVKGLVKAAGSVGSALLKIAQDAIGGFLGFLGIHSPSKLFEGFGENTIQGYVNGMKALQALAAETMVATVAAPVAALGADVGSTPKLPGSTAGAVAGGTVSSSSVTNNNSFNLDGGDPYKVAWEVVNRLGGDVGNVT